MIYNILAKIFRRILHLYYLSEIKNAEKYSKCKIRFVPQGSGGGQQDPQRGRPVRAARVCQKRA